MSRGFWITLIVVVLFIAVAIVAAGPRLLRYYISEYQVVQQLENVTHRRVRVDSVDVSLWRGLRLNRVEISEHPGWEAGVWIRANEVSLQPKLWSLLWGRVRMDSVRVTGFEMSLLHRSRDGWNVARGFTQTTQKEPNPDGSDTGEASGSASGGSGIGSGSLPNMELVQGEIHVRDEVVDQSFSLRFQQVDLAGFDPSRGGTVELENVILPEGNILGTARVQFRPFRLFLRETRVNFVELGPFVPFLKHYLTVDVPFKNLTLNARIERGQWDTRGIRGEGQVEVSGLQPPDNGVDTPFIRRAGFEGRVDWDRKSSRLQFEFRKPRINRTVLAHRVRGMINPPWDHPQLHADVDLGGMKIRTLTDFASRWGRVKVPRTMPIHGTFSESNITVKGRWPSLEWSGSMKFKNLELEHPTMGRRLKVSGLNLGFNGSRLTIREGTVSIPDHTMSVEGTVSDYQSFPESRVDVTVKGQHLDIESLLEYLRETGVSVLPVIQASGTLDQLELDLTGPVSHPEWDARGRLVSTQFRTPLLPRDVMDVNGDVRLTAKRLEVSRISGTYAESPFNLNGWLELPVTGKSSFTLRGGVTSFPAETILRMVPSGWVPDGLSFRGPVTIREAVLEGPWRRLSWSGELRPDGMTLNLPRLSDGLNNVRGTVQTSGRLLSTGDTDAGRSSRLDIRSSGRLEGRFRDNPFRLAGTLPYPLDSSTDFTLRGTISRLPLEWVSGLVPRPLFGEQLSVTGPVSIRDGVINGPLKQMSWGGQVELLGTQIESPNLPTPLRDVRGALEMKELGDTAAALGNGVKPSRLVMDLKGIYRDRSFLARGFCQLPFDERQPFNLELTIEHIPLDAVLELFPHPIVPEQMELTGPVTVRNVHVIGPLTDLEWEGDVVAEGINLRAPFLNDPLTEIRGTIWLNRSLARMQQMKSRMGPYELTLSGDLRRTPRNWEPDVTMNTDTMPVPFLLSQIRELPNFPPGWKPGGEVNLEARMTGSMESPRIQGTLRAPTLSMGSVVGHGATSEFLYEDGKLSADPIKMSVFDGRLEGLVSVTKIGTTPDLGLRTRLSRLQLAEMLRSLTGAGQNSQGRLEGDVHLSGPAGNFSQFSGPVELSGQNLRFEGVAAMKRLSVVLNTNLTRVLETGLGGAILNIITLDFARSTEKLKSMFTSDITTQFQEGQLSVTFEKGRGSIRKLKLKNKELEIVGEGTIWLDGRLDLVLTIKPRAPLLNKIEKDWLRSIFSGGFPELGVKGTLQDPVFEQERLRNGLIERFIRFLTPGPSSTSKKESS